jgi:hypothetical protein
MFHEGISLYAMVLSLSKRAVSARFQGSTRWQIGHCAEQREFCYNT